MYLAIDYGKKRIGLAIGSQYPRGIGTLDNPGSFDYIAGKIASICKDHDVESIVMGMPSHRSGDKGELWHEIKELADLIEKRAHKRIIFEEEAYTSVEAEEELKSRGVNPSREKDKVDELAAVLILEQYINKLKIHNL